MSLTGSHPAFSAHSVVGFLRTPGTCKIAGPKAYWTQSLGAYCQVYVYIGHSAVTKSTSWTRIHLNFAETQQGLFSLKLPDIHLYLINPQVYQMKVLFGRSPSESQGLLPFSSREVNLWVIEPHALVTKRTGNPVVSV